MFHSAQSFLSCHSCASSDGELIVHSHAIPGIEQGSPERMLDAVFDEVSIFQFSLLQQENINNKICELHCARLKHLEIVGW